MCEQLKQSKRVFNDLLKDLHKDLKLAGDPKNAILNISEELLSYLVLLLRDEIPRKTVSTDEEWFELIDELRSHGIIPLLYWKIGRLPSELKPSEIVQDKMRMIFLASRTLSLQMENQLKKISDAFSKKGIDLIVLKGPALARTYYPDPVTRSSDDIDLLVKPDDFIESRNILKSLGYLCTGNRFEKSKGFFCEEVFIHEKKEAIFCQVELHWDLLSFDAVKRKEQTEDLFNHSVLVDSPSVSFYSLSRIDMLLHLVLHLGWDHNQSMRLNWIYDIYLLAKSLKSPEDWEELQVKCVDWNAVFAMKYSLEMIKVWTGFDLPDQFSDLTKWPEPSITEKIEWPDAVCWNKSVKSMFKLHHSQSSGIFEKLMYVFNLIFPPSETIKRSFPPSNDLLLPFSYLRRW